LPTSHPQLSIVIVNWNTRELLAQCLTSVYAHPPEAPFEVVVVDNTSCDASPRIVREQFPQVHLIENTTNVGFARGTNAGIGRSTGDYVLLLNSDTVVRSGALDALIGCLEAHPRARACGPRLLNGDGSFHASYADFPTLATEVVHQFGLARVVFGGYYPSHDPRDSTTTRAVDWVGGACLLIRRDCLKVVGLLDEAFVMYGEEMDWCYRLQRHGWETWYSPDAEVVHFGGGSANQVPVWMYLQLQRGRVRFFRKHYGRVSAISLICLIRAASLLKIAAVLFAYCAARFTRRTGGGAMRWRSYLAACTAPL
jgi:GT2 family glycosyltransferase